MTYSFLAEEIAKCHKTGKFKGAIVTGPKRIGKTAYAIKVMRDVFMILYGIDKDTAYQMAVKAIFFDVGPFMDVIQEKQDFMRNQLPDMDWAQRIPICTVDDASLHAGAHLWFLDRAKADSFQQMLTTVGTAISGLIFTTPDYHGLLKGIREYFDYYIIPITIAPGRHCRLATIKEPYTSKWGARKLRKTGRNDAFTCYIPKPYYTPYMAQRIDQGSKVVAEARKAWSKIPKAKERVTALPNLEELNKVKVV